MMAVRDSHKHVNIQVCRPVTAKSNFLWLFRNKIQQRFAVKLLNLATTMSGLPFRQIKSYISGKSADLRSKNNFSLRIRHTFRCIESCQMQPKPHFHADGWSYENGLLKRCKKCSLLR